MINGKKIKELRERAGLTQRELAEAINVNRSMVAKYETGESQMGLETLMVLCGVLKTTPNEVLGVEVAASPAAIATRESLDRQLLQVLADQLKEKQNELDLLRSELLLTKKGVHK
jgi:transcriptional regulator with XRE-family HTH domain